MDTPKRGKYAAFFMAILVSMAMTGCQTDTVEEALPSEFDSGEYAVFDYEDSMDAFKSASLEEPMEMDTEICSGEVFVDARRFGHCAPWGPWGLRVWRHRWGNHLGRIIWALDLTREQLSQVRDLMATHRDCVKGPLAAICETNHGIIQAANEQLRAIIESLKNGDIGRYEALEQIKALNQSTREAIREDPDNQDQREALCECKLTLFDNIQAILDEDQQGIWDDWVDGLQGPCFDEE